MEIDDLLNGKYRQPPELVAIKEYVLQTYGVQVTVATKGNDLVIYAPSSALAATLRLEMSALKQAVKTNKKLIIRIV